MAQRKDIVSTINDLIITLKDGQQGFKEAAEGVADAQLKSVFNEYSQQRSRFAAELQNEARRLGESEPEESSSTAGAMHRTWINLKSAIATKQDHAVLAEYERGEDSAVKEYNDAFKESLSPTVRGIIEHQYKEIKAAHDLVKGLRDAAKKP